MKNKEKIRTSFSVAPQTANVTATAPDSVNEGGKNLKFLGGKNLIFIAYAAPWWKSMIFIVLSYLEIVHDTVQYR